MGTVGYEMENRSGGVLHLMGQLENGKNKKNVWRYVIKGFWMQGMNDV